MEIAIAILTIAYLAQKIVNNTDPEKDEDEEAAANKGAVKHQGWQTLDWTEPWK